MIQLLHLAPFNRAQRLSASSEFAHPTCASVHEFSNSAQRLSASSEFAHRFYGTHARSEMCSTPFGIIGIRTRGDDDGLRVRFLCSTPFGIIGIRTAKYSKCAPARSCAQRLSASSEFAQAEILNGFRFS